MISPQPKVIQSSTHKRICVSVLKDLHDLLCVFASYPGNQCYSSDVQVRYHAHVSSNMPVFVGVLYQCDTQYCITV